jgi:hypothetical protein
MSQRQRQDELAAILAEETVRATTFTEHLIERLAKALGIDRKLAIADYRHAATDDGPGGTDGREDDSDDDDDDGLGGSAELFRAIARKFA